MKTNLSNKDYVLPKFLYKELEYFCLQYKYKMAEIDQLYSPTTSNYKTMGHGEGSISDPTYRTAERICKLKRDCEMIEQCAADVFPAGYMALMCNIISGSTYDQIKACGVCVPCGRRQFYSEYRRKFFYLLSSRRELL